ncbi:16S rRNA (cytidine(1402)-2'-O)-methyltransferase [Stappia sp.]|jgi:16S rRNA (cytidine1402-2'-O)-methyltransferase|uniref:16S rRNA (cytidine(1402)-2'-O)-methyltransferase n=1 Tax=Stappia sp. TaxID=1870903 RepID=UPI003A98EFA7
MSRPDVPDPQTSLPADDHPQHAPEDGKRTAEPKGRDDFFIGAQRFEAPRQEPGLYIVSTPIGNLGDITVRGLETLAGADLVACEDTRVTATLMRRFGLKTPLTAYHEHNAERARPKLLGVLAAGGKVALVSDAGTPLVSDPGYRLVKAVLAEGHKVIPIPGASAPLAALVGAGLPSDTVCFAGFLPVKSGQRTSRLAELSRVPATLVFFESPRRVAASLADMAGVFGKTREAVVARELTKTFETFERGTLSELARRFDGETVRGEIVVVVAPPEPRPEADPADADRLLAEALATMKPAAAAKQVSQLTGVERKDLYARALTLKSGEGDAS